MLKGGVGLNPTYNKSHKEAFTEFVSNSTFKVLTDSTMAGLTLIATKKATYVSPYVSFSPETKSFLREVTNILIKIIPCTPDNPAIADLDRIPINASTHPVRKRYKPTSTFSVSKQSDIERECDVQRYIVRNCLVNYETFGFFTICPSILYTENPVTLETHANIYRFISNPLLLFARKDTTSESEAMLVSDTTTITPDDYLYVDPQAISEIKEKIASSQTGLYSIIAMEFLDGYTVAEDFFKTNTYLNNKLHYDTLATLEIKRLHEMGIMHNDIHENNIMFNPNIQFVTNDPTNTSMLGKAMLIDFGLSSKKTGLTAIDNSFKYMYDEMRGILENCTRNKPDCVKKITDELMPAAEKYGNIVKSLTRTRMDKIILPKMVEVSSFAEKMMYKIRDKPLIHKILSKFYGLRKKIALNGGGEIELEDFDLDTFIDIYVGQLMQDQTLNEFNLIKLLEENKSKPVKTVQTNVVPIETAVAQPVYGGRKRTKKHKTRRVGRKQKTRSRKTKK